jgi:hypothetical protein
MDANENGGGEVRFFLVGDEPGLDSEAPWSAARGPGSRLAAARAAAREAQQAEGEERARVSRAPIEGLTATHAALLQTRQAQSQAAIAAVEELRRRAAWLRQAIAVGEEAVARQRQLLDRLRRELAEIGE